MSIRQKIFQNPRVGMAVAGVAVVIGIISIALQMRNRSTPGTVTESFFTVDDGKTWFTDSAANIPPYDKDGKQAVRAFVYRCANGTQFVNHLERFKPEAKTALENVDIAAPNPKGPLAASNIIAIKSAYAGGREVKRPGQPKWIDTGNFREAGDIMAVKCPTGGNDAVPVDP